MFACDLQTIALFFATSVYVLETVRGAVRRLLKKSRIAPFNAIFIINFEPGQHKRRVCRSTQGSVEGSPFGHNYGCDFF